MESLTQPRNVPLTVLVTASEAEELRELMWRSRRPLSGWLREVALQAARRLARQAAAPDSGT